MSTDEFDLTATAGKFTPGRRKNNFAASAAPGVGDDADDGYEVGSVWIDTTGDTAYICVDPSAGAAVWDEIGAGGVTDHGALTGLTDDDHTQYIKDAEFTAKGDVLAGTGSGTFAAVTVGSDGQAVGADSNQTEGIRWGGFPELVMEDGVTNPPVPVENEAQDDWIYADF